MSINSIFQGTKRLPEDKWLAEKLSLVSPEMELSWMGKRRKGQFVSYENVGGLPLLSAQQKFSQNPRIPHRKENTTL